MTRFDNFVAIDLETTGLNPTEDEITELGAARYVNGKLVDTFSRLVRPSKPIPPGIVRLTGINDKLVESAPKIDSVFEDFQDFIDDSPWLVGHNVSFDLGFLRILQAKKVASDIERKALDTGVLARVLFPRLPRYSLGTLIEYFRLKRDKAHRALSDCLATGQVYLKLISHLASLSISSREAVGRVLFGSGNIEIFRRAIMEIEPESINMRAMAVLLKDRIDKSGELLKEYPDNVIGESPPDAYDDYIAVDPAAVENHFLPGGILSGTIPSYEYRPQQSEMAINITNAFNRSEFLLAEAPTGVGKSVAYLLPASWWASLNGEQVIISTQTKNLQWQLFYKDIPQIHKAVGYRFKAILAKGRGNYLCLYKYHELMAEAEASFSRRDREALSALLFWVQNTKTGDISECHGFNPSKNNYIWSRISCEGAFCLGQACRFADRCYLLRIKREIQKAQIIVVNHYLTFADFASGGDLVRNAGHVIFDEAHNLERVAASYLGHRLDKRVLDHLLADMYSSRPKQAGFLVNLKYSVSVNGPDDELAALLDSVIDSIIGLGNLSRAFFEKLSWNIPSRLRKTNMREISYNSKKNPCAIPESEEFISALKTLYECLEPLIEKLREFDELPKKRESIVRLEAFVGDLSGLIEMVSDLLLAENSDFVYWIELPVSDRQTPKLLSAPLEVGKLLDQEFYDYLKTSIFTSATMAVEGKFDYINRRLGLDLSSKERSLSICLDSPFDIDSEVAVVTAGYMPSPRDPGFEGSAIESLPEILKSGAEKSMVLFTSHSSLRAAAGITRDSLESAGIRLFVQDGSFSAERILERFKTSKRAALFGTDAFWEGVDLPGDLLQLLILFKLPFTAPDRPWFKANLERIEKRGENPFAKLSLPDAVVKFRQGFGRLIRTSKDRGCVVVLDSRIENSSFGKTFLNSVGGTKFRCKSTAEIVDAVKSWLRLKR